MYLKHWKPVSMANSAKIVVTYLQTLLEFLLLLVDNTQSEVDFIRFLKVWLHAHDL
jgi:hypothetical protein